MQTQLLPPAEHWPPSRAEALERIARFVPSAGRTYAAERNYDRGPAERGNVSELSPYLRTRTITESEVLAAVLIRHSPAKAEKFVQEVFWRTYWKGWLESHPAAWSRYRERLTERLAELDARPDLQNAYAAAVQGRTGIDAFDAWARELEARHYLHNHARMWFASIWIFTLELPWELGADMFLRRLLDGDPASNTLSWRWVAGLHTRGRTYLATRDNIRRYTDGRFELGSPLARSAQPLDDPALPLVALPDLPTGMPARMLDDGAILVVHDDDLHGDLDDLPERGVRVVYAIRTAHARSPQPVDPAVVTFTDTVSREAVSRIAAQAGARDGGLIEAVLPAEISAAIVHAARAVGVSSVVALYAPVGPTREVLAEVRAGVEAAGLRYAEFRRRYDAVSWPAATRGFFNLRSRIPAILAQLGIGAG